MSKIAVVTAGSRGIGAATSLAFAQAGYDVVVNYVSDTKSAGAVAKKIEAAGQRAVLVRADAFTEEGIKEIFAQTAAVFPKIDVLVNNAGNPHEPEFGSYTFDDVNTSLGANFGAAVLCTQEAVKLMDEGSILFTSSIYGLPFGGNTSVILYSAGKAAMINFAQTMAERLAPKIRCNVVAPGFTFTHNWDGANPDYIARNLDLTLQ